MSNSTLYIIVLVHLLFTISHSWTSRLLLSESKDSKEEEVPALTCEPSDPVWNNDNPMSPFYTIDICDGLYVYGDGVYMGMFLVSATGVIFVDAPAQMALVIPNIAATRTNNPITTVIYSHHHLDHIGAAQQIPNIDTSDIICHELTLKQIKSKYELNKNIPLCTKTFDEERETVTDSNQQLIVYHAGFRWHTNNDLFIFAPKQRTIMSVDLVFPNWIPFKNLGLASDPHNYRKAHDFVLGIKSDKYGDWLNFVGGHVDAVGNRDDVLLNRKYYDEILVAAAEGIQNVQFGQFLQHNFPGGFDGTNTWQIVKGFLDAQAEECDRIMIDEKGWDQQLKGTESYNFDNCWWAGENLRINLA